LSAPGETPVDQDKRILRSCLKILLVFAISVVLALIAIFIWFINEFRFVNMNG
jgi:accessory gene regulator protein AgrB